MTTFSAHGKLLLSAEYMVLHGALALALPLRQGQTLTIRPMDDGRDDPRILWEATHAERVWFRLELSWPDLTVLQSSDPAKSHLLVDALLTCVDMNPEFLASLRGVHARTAIGFDPAWGWGSSSTLLHLLAAWAGVDPLSLHFRVSRGSGYDVACAGASGPILYQKEGDRARVEALAFRPPFLDRLYFAWLGRKQSTDTQLQSVRDILRPSENQVRQFSRYTRTLAETRDLDTFRRTMTEHESELASLLKRDSPVKDFQAGHTSAKSLGAWGGDFMLLASTLPESGLRAHLQRKGIHTLFAYKNIALDERI